MTNGARCTCEVKFRIAMAKQHSGRRRRRRRWRRWTRRKRRRIRSGRRRRKRRRGRRRRRSRRIRRWRRRMRRRNRQRRGRRGWGGAKEEEKKKLPLFLVGTTFQVSVVRNTISPVWFLLGTFKILFIHNIFGGWSVQQQSRDDMVFNINRIHDKVCRLKKFLIPD